MNQLIDEKNQLTMEYTIKNLFGILAIMNVSVINHVKLENI